MRVSLIDWHFLAVARERLDEALSDFREEAIAIASRCQHDEDRCLMLSIAENGPNIPLSALKPESVDGSIVEPSAVGANRRPFRPEAIRSARRAGCQF